MPHSPLLHKRILFLGSSVTYGHCSGGVAFPELLAEATGCEAVKEAVSGTTLVPGDRDYIRQKLGIEPCQYADFKSMVGDTADNIRGAEKIGQKTAAQLLSRFGSLEGILANCQQVEKPSIRRSLEENANRLRKNYMLIRLDGEETVPFTPEEMAYTYGGETSRQVLSAIGIQ